MARQYDTANPSMWRDYSVARGDDRWRHVIGIACSTHAPSSSEQPSDSPPAPCPPTTRAASTLVHGELAGGSSARLSAHQRPAGFLEVRHDVAVTPFAVASLGRYSLMDSATIHLPAVKDHDVFVLADKFHVGIRAWFRRRHDEQQTGHGHLRRVPITTHASAGIPTTPEDGTLLRDDLRPRRTG